MWALWAGYEWRSFWEFYYIRCATSTKAPEKLHNFLLNCFQWKYCEIIETELNNQISLPPPGSTDNSLSPACHTPPPRHQVAPPYQCKRSLSLGPVMADRPTIAKCQSLLCPCPQEHLNGSCWSLVQLDGTRLPWPLPSLLSTTCPSNRSPRSSALTPVRTCRGLAFKPHP